MKTVNYVVLAGLLLRPRSGYDLARWTEGVAGHFFSVGHSSVYPALADLERRGLVAHEVVTSDRGPERKVYSPTEAGREALLGWAEEPAPMPRIRDEGLVKALCFGHLPEGRALALLAEVKERHAQKLAEYEGYERDLRRSLREGGISGEAYLGTLLALRRGVGEEEGYVRWCDEAANLLSSVPPRPPGGRDPRDGV
ncbi:MAG: PadR family transcriptional regulator [Actinomycetota bacterium]|nr:PadR family transcriptional regulator [Actinomycetota bacterium]